MGFKGRDSVRDGFTSLQILTVYSLYVLETIKYLKGFCLPTMYKKISLIVRDKLKKSKLTVQNFFGKNLVMRAEHF